MMDDQNQNQNQNQLSEETSSPKAITMEIEEGTKTLETKRSSQRIMHPLLETTFGSSGNMTGGAALLYGDDIENEAQMTMSQRVKANFKLIMQSSAAGFGMFSEAYFLFALGNVKNIWHETYPTCFGSNVGTGYDNCSHGLVASLSYLEVGMVMVGMLTFGFIASKLGRRIGSISTAVIMCVGGILQTAAVGADLTGLFAFFAVALGLFSYGVGGEYPLASASAAERAEAQKHQQSSKTHVRGKTVVLTFAMQGWGNWINTALFCIILAGFGCQHDATCSPSSFEWTWRLQYGIGSFLLLILVLGRVLFLKESQVWLANRDKKLLENKNAQADGTPVKKKGHFKLFMKNYWHRLLGTSLTWYVWDVVFYGNKLFQGTIIANIIGSSPSVFDILIYTLINSSFALIGYYCSAYTIDRAWMGRRRLQNMGFLMTFVLFLICGVAYPELSKPENTGWFQMLYYMSSFFGQFGPNATTWLLPSELFPTDVRTEAHGFSAAMGKAGALTATLLFTYGNSGNPMGAQTIFYICAACGIAGLIATFVLIPEITTLDLSENDRLWEALQANETYEGPARKPEYMSWIETLIYRKDTEERCESYSMNSLEEIAVSGREEA